MFMISLFQNILNNKKISFYTKSINILHVIKFHPLYLRNKESFRPVYQFIKFLSFLSSILKFKHLNKKILTEKKILIISHFINHNQLNSKSDFYFGDFEKILKNYKISFFKIMINHTNYKASSLNKKIKNKNQIILEKNLGLYTEGKILFKKLFSTYELLILFFKNSFSYKILIKLLISLYGSQTTFSLRIHFQIMDIVKKIKPDHCLFTYEGYAWERMCINAIKSVNPKINCIGYQHTLVTNNHFTIFKNMIGNFNPDQIWCSNFQSFQILKKKIHKFLRKKIFLTGGFHKLKRFKTNINKKNFFLVIPEGIYSECEELFKFTLSLAKKYQNLNFIWRVHPVIVIKKVLNNLKLSKKNIPRNIFISKNNFDKDASKCQFALYKGSSAVIKSVLSGSYPIFFNNPKERNFDPLINYFKKNNYIKDEKSFLALINKLNRKNYKIELMNKIKLIKKNIFTKLNLIKIKKNLKFN